jgi:succinoglycan biosynthesis transport protein ExoP
MFPRCRETNPARATTAKTMSTTHTPLTSHTSSAAALQLAEVWRYKLLVPAIALLVTGAVAFWVVRQPKVYEAVANLEYDPFPSKPLGDQEHAGSPYAFWDTREFYATQNFILRSRSLAERVVRRLSLNTDPDYMRVPAGMSKPPTFTVEQAALRLMKSIELQQVRDTRVVAVHVRDSNPDRAQLVANTLLDAYIEKSLEDRLGTSASALEWLNGQMQNLKRDLESAELALYRFREDNHSLSASLSERQKLITGQLQNYSNALTSIHTKRVETEARLQTLRDHLANQPDLMSVRVGPLADDPLVAALREQARSQSFDLQKLTITYGDAHPQVRALHNTLESTRAQLNAQIAAIVAGVEAELRALERAETGVQSALNQVNQQGLELSLQEIEYTRLDRERGSKAHLFDTVLNRTAETDLTRALRVANARVLDRAVKPTVAVSPRVQFTVFMGLVVGLLLGVAATFLVARVDNKVRNAADIEARGVTVLGVLPDIESSGKPALSRRSRRDGVVHKDRDLIVHLQPKSTIAECSRTIRTNITFQAADRPLRTIAVTSAVPREGKTTVSLSIAITFAQSGRRVLLVDTDLRKPRLHRVFGIAPGLGITSILAGEASLSEATCATEVPNLWILPCGPLPPNPSELLHTRRFSDLIAEIQQTYDVSVLDSPPVGAVTDPVIISTQVDGTLIVASSRSSTRANLHSALRQLRTVGGRVVGAVLNGASRHNAEYGYYSGSYRYYYGDDSRSSPPVQTRET